MIYRQATRNDLPKLKNMFTDIVKHMCINGIDIWDEIYPTTIFEKDIENNRLYVLEDNKNIVAAFALWEDNDSDVQWHIGNAMYLGRLGVHIDYLKQGLGTLALQYAKSIAQQNNMDYIRLYVVDSNQPAINLYIKNGFIQVEGMRIDLLNDRVLNEFGFEWKI